MRFGLAVALGAAFVLGDLSQLHAQYRPLGGFGYGPSLGGWNSQYMVPGYPYYGNGRPSNSSYYSRGNGYNNYGRRSVSVAPRPQVAAQPVGDGLPIKIFNPADSGTELHYLLNGTEYALRPGESQMLTNDRAWVLKFDRGGDYGSVEYALSGGQYWFELTGDHGWEAYHDADVSKLAPPKPDASPKKNPLPKK